MHGRGCSHDMGAGRNFWVSGALLRKVINIIMLSAALLLVRPSQSSTRVSITRMEDNNPPVVGAETPFSILDGRVLTPGSDGDGWWDGRCAAMPIVLAPTDTRPWRCFYYGRPGASWNNDFPAFLPTGISGLAESDDGLNWKRVTGPLKDGYQRGGPQRRSPAPRAAWLSLWRLHQA